MKRLSINQGNSLAIAKHVSEIMELALSTWPWTAYGKSGWCFTCQRTKQKTGIPVSSHNSLSVMMIWQDLHESMQIQIHVYVDSVCLCFPTAAQKHTEEDWLQSQKTACLHGCFQSKWSFQVFSYAYTSGKQDSSWSRFRPFSSFLKVPYLREHKGSTKHCIQTDFRGLMLFTRAQNLGPSAVSLYKNDTKMILWVGSIPMFWGVDTQLFL